MIQNCNQNCSFCFIHYTHVMSNDNLFKGISKEEIGEIIHSIHHQVRQYEQGEMLINEEEPYNSLILLLSGSVRTEMMNNEGQIFVLDTLEAPSSIAPGILFASQPHITVSVVARQKCRVLIIPKEQMHIMLVTNPKVLNNFITIISNRVQFLSQRIKGMQFQSLKSKFSNHILQLSKLQNTHHIKLQKTQQELSEIFGVARPSLARIIREMHNQGIIKANGKHIEILNIDKLTNI